jgi:hypothetical protein
MTVEDFHKCLKRLISEVEMAELGMTPTEGIIETLLSEVYRLESCGTRFMHQMQETY